MKKEIINLWKHLGDIPVNDDGIILEQFLHFEIGTQSLNIWHWFENYFNIRVIDLMFPANTIGKE